jgi:ketosteroid isomerase-like protein
MELEGFFTIYKNSVWNKDSQSLIDMYDKHAVIFDMWDQGCILSSAEWAKNIRDWLGSLGDENVNVEFDNVQIHQAENLAIATAFIKYEAISSEGNVLRSMKNRITVGFSKSDNGWKVIHQHISAPVSSDNLTAILDI